MSTLLDPACPVAADLVDLNQPGAPTLMPWGDGIAPVEPSCAEETGLEPGSISDLILKLCSTVPYLTVSRASERLCLPESLIEKVCWQLKHDQLIEILGQTGECDYRYAVTQRGRDFARRALEMSGYIGPAPVSLAAYRAMLEWQVARRPAISLERVKEALAGIVLPPESVEVSALAALSGRSLFLFGPPGNGKTSLARMLHNVLGGELWVPHCVSVDSSVIRIFDPQIHQAIEGEPPVAVDRRWVRIRPPLVVVGGEMTLAELDLSYSPSLRFYEAPPHVKANGGTFIIDDFGRQRVEPHDLLNRWIIPLEHQVDFLTLHTGQRIEIPFRLMLTVATNLKVSDVADAAFLRRMGYRLHLEQPTPQMYAQIFQRYAGRLEAAVPPGLIEQILKRYQQEQRDLRASEPRDLIERAKDICRLRQQELSLDPEVMDLAWRAYFGLTSA